MAATFPASLDTFTAIPSGTKQGAAIGSRVHREFHNDMGDAIEALEAKLGIGSSTPTNQTVLAGNGAGTSAWTGSPTLANVTTTGGVYAASGGSGNPTLSFSADTTTGGYRVSSGVFGIATAGTHRAQISSAGLEMGTNLPIIPAALSGTPAQHALHRGNVPKMWCTYTSVTTTAILDSFNVVSLTDNGIGDTTITIDRDFATPTFVVLAGVDTGAFTAVCTGKTAGTARIQAFNGAAAAVDVVTNVVAMGGQ